MNLIYKFLDSSIVEVVVILSTFAGVILAMFILAWIKWKRNENGMELKENGR